MPGVVSGAGSLLGGVVAQKLMKGKDAPPGGGTPGLTTSQGSGKNGKNGATVQIDPNQVMAFYKQAVTEQEKGFNQGLQYYQSAMELASKEVKRAFTDANNTLRPLSESSNLALNEQMRMMGLDPVAKTKDFYKTAAQLGANDSIQNQLAKADTLKDPTERATARQNIMSAFQTQNTQSLAGLQNKLKNLEGNAPTLPTMGYNSAYERAWLTNQKLGYKAIDPNDNYLDNQRMMQMDYSELLNRYDSQMAAYNAEKANIQAQLNAAQAKATDLQNFANQWNINYTDTYDKGYTGEEVTNKIESTPGYSFIVDQGTKAIERQGAAKGMLGSANTEIALQQFGQNTAQSYYTSYMDNLARIVQEGSGATAQIADNQVKQGGMLADIDRLVGQAAMDTSRAIGQYKADNLSHQGDMWYQIAATNAALQQKQFAMNTDRNTSNSTANYQQQMGNAANTEANAKMISAIGGL